MALSPFPDLSSTFASVSSLASKATNALGGFSKAGSTNFDMAKLDGLVSRAGGGIGSSLSGLTGDGGLGGLGSAIGGIGANVKTALGGIGGLANAASDIGQSINKLGLGGALGGIGSLATSISSAAGQLNNVLSLFRGKNLPDAGELFNKQGAAVELVTAGEGDWRVRINANFDLFGSSFSRLKSTSGVVWPYTPKVSVSTKANYTQIDPVHSNYPFQAYKNSAVDDITISGEFSCETDTDAAYWLAATHFFKTATKMFFGGSTYAGNPPIICQLSGYGPGVFNSVPVIIKSFTVDLPDEVNYIKCTTSHFTQGGSTWVPVMSNITVVVSPIYNRQLLRRFSLQQYADGKAVGYM
jgi:hypothetical protein